VTEPEPAPEARPGKARPGNVSLAAIVRDWGRIGCTGFGGPPAHIALLRALCVDRRGWLSAAEFEDGIAATGLLPGPASTQLAIFCAWRLRGVAGALVGGACFIVPGLVFILGLSALFLAAKPPLLVLGAAGGAGAAVPAVAAAAATGLAPPGWRRAGTDPGGRAPPAPGGATPPDPPAPNRRARWAVYLAAGAAAAATIGPWLALVIAACGLIELAAGSRTRPLTGWPAGPRRPAVMLPALAPSGLAPAATAGGLAAVAWVAFKVGALSYGGGFVIIPLIQHDAVQGYHWMTNAQFLDAVALGQITPGPVVLTVAAVGYAAHGIGGALLATLIAFSPSFAFVIAGGPRFSRLRGSLPVQAFLTGASAAAIGAIAGATIPLAHGLTHLWQLAVLALAAAWLLALRRGVVAALTGAAVLGIIAALAGAPLSR